MATRDFILKPGQPVPDSMRALLDKLISPTEWENMAQRGARVRIITTVPWPPPPKVPKLKRVIDADYIGQLKSLATDESALEREVGILNGPQILQLGQLLGIPMAKKTKLASLRAQLTNSLRSEIVWRGISGAAGAPPSPNSLEPQSTE